MKNKALFICLAIILISQASAITINSAYADDFSPGKEGRIDIEIKNILNDDVSDVSLNLQLTNLPFIPIGSSSESVDKIKENDEENFVFQLKTSSDIKPSDYEIPYTIEYKVSGEIIKKTGTIGVKVLADPILDFTISAKNPVINEQGTLALKIINKGFSDAKFVSINLISPEFHLLSDDKIYIGTIASDDFETANFDVLYTQTNPSFFAEIEYLNFENEKITETIELPFTIYTLDRAEELGIKSQSTLAVLIPLAVTLILIIVLIRLFRKKQRLKRTNSKFNQ